MATQEEYTKFQEDLLLYILNKTILNDTSNYKADKIQDITLKDMLRLTTIIDLKENIKILRTSKYLIYSSEELQNKINKILPRTLFITIHPKLTNMRISIYVKDNPDLNINQLYGLLRIHGINLS